MVDRLPDDMNEIIRWRNEDAPEWLDELITDWQMGYETAYIMDDLGVRDIEEWDSVRIDADAADAWEITITYDDGTSETIDFGDRWESAWGMYDLADGRDDLEAERGDIDYSETT